MNARDLRTRFDLEHVTAINELIHAADAVKTPAMPDVPDWDDSPDSLECIGDETRTPEELIAIGLEWQALAVKLNDLLVDATAPGEWGDLENVVAGLQEKAERAREAMITLGGYEPRRPVRP